MLQGMQRFTRGLLRQPLWVQLWVGVLILVNGLIPLRWFDRPEARAAIVVLMLGGLLMAAITARTGFTRLLGLGHVAWLGLVPWIWSRLPLHASDPAFSAWMRVLVAVNLVSLAIDTVDVARYLRGERAETVSLD